MDLFSSKKVKCAGCGNKIDAKEKSVEALKKKYHANCFACANCKKTISGEFHPVDDKPWCEECFLKHKAPKCADCGKGILGERIKTDDGRSYHEECFKNASQGICGACQNNIGLAEPVTEALNQTFHKGCFRCIECQSELPGKFHVNHAGQQLCDKCHKKEKKMEEELNNQESFSETVVQTTTTDAPKGHGGETQVRNADEPQNGNFQTETVVRNADGSDPSGKSWNGLPAYRQSNVVVDDLPAGHCSVCKTGISSGTIVGCKGKSFHDECFNNAYSGECSGCNQKIFLTQPSVSVASLGRDWHTDCLNCGLCNSKIPGAFQLRDQIPTCEQCFNGKLAPACAGCDQVVEGTQLKAMHMVWHPDCFNCAVCGVPLYQQGKDYYNVEGRPYCQRDVEAAGETIRVI